LVEIGDPASLEVVVDVLTSDAVRIGPGAPVLLDRWGGEPLAAHVRAVEPQAFTRMSALGVEEQRVNVLVQIDADRSRWIALGDAFRVEARVEVARVDGALVVPESTLVRISGESAVFRVVDGSARLTPVELGLRNGIEAEVKGGLGAADVVVIHPNEAVADGVRVRGGR
jgi:HlyD family secretion protein